MEPSFMCSRCRKEHIGECADVKELKQQRDDLQQQLAGMTDSAKHFSGGMEYYRDLIDEAAKSIGIAMYTADDQGVHPDPLRAKLPECVAELVQQRDVLLARYNWLTSLFERKWNGVVGSGCRYAYTLVGNWRHSIAPLSGETLGEAIDAAMKEQK